MNKTNINFCWASLMVEELVRQGIEYFCVAPGSRSSPLAEAVANHPKARACVHFDERGLAFHALGYVAATKKPAVLICTSGTAVANFLPAVIETSKKKLPLIVITADRPPELRLTGAVQTIEQVGIFGSYVKWATDMPCPDLKIKPAYVLTTMDQAYYQSVRFGGVVHINCMFREPLAPVPSKEPLADYLVLLKTWQKSNLPYTSYVTAFESIALPTPKKIVSRLEAIKNGVIVVGKIASVAEGDMVVGLAEKLGWPIFADISSGLRLGVRHKNIIHYFDHLLLAKDMVKHFNFDGVLHLGGRMTSKRFYDLVDRINPKEYIFVINHALRNDPLHQVTLRVESPVGNFVETVIGLVKARKSSTSLLALQKVNMKAEKIIQESMDERLSEGGLARLISQQIPEGQGLFISNSMPIRDMDFYADFKGNRVVVNGNRGASGIDGIIASASGFAVGLNCPVTLVIGDLAALHDLNSLALLKSLTVPVVMVVVNNGGGGIFSFLPISGSKNFERFWGTPHAMTFANAAAMFELNYAQAIYATDFKNAYTKAQQSKTSTIIEVFTTRAENKSTHDQLLERFKRGLSK